MGERMQQNPWIWSEAHNDHYRVEVRDGRNIYIFGKQTSSSSSGAASNPQYGTPPTIHSSASRSGAASNSQYGTPSTIHSSPSSSGAASNSQYGTPSTTHSSPSSSGAVSNSQYGAPTSIYQMGSPISRSHPSTLDTPYGQLGHRPQPSNTSSGSYRIATTPQYVAQPPPQYGLPVPNQTSVSHGGASGYQTSGPSSGVQGVAASAQDGALYSNEPDGIQPSDHDMSISQEIQKFPTRFADRDPSFRSITAGEEWVYWQPGTVFRARLLAEGENVAPGPTVVDYGDHFEKVYPFIVVKAFRREHWSYCLRITTYGEKATTKPGVDQRSHTIVFTDENAPAKLSEETKMNKDPIRIIPIDQSQKLHPLSRVKLNKLYVIEHNIRVKHVGRVSGTVPNGRPQGDLKKLLAYCTDYQ